MLKFLNMNDESYQKKVQVVVIAQNELLLLEFNKIRPNDYVGFQNITGGVEGVESYETAALREVVEEIGVNTNILIDLKIEFKFHDRWKRNCIEKVFLCHFNKKPPIILSDEHVNFKWVNLSLVEPTDYVFPTNFEAFMAAKKYAENIK